MSTPTGGYILWVELPTAIDSYRLYKTAIKHGISVAPGSMFSLQERYTHCIRLSYGMAWKPEVERALITLGRLIKQMAG